LDTVDLLCACYEGLGDGEAATRLMEESYAECRVGAGNIPYRTVPPRTRIVAYVVVGLSAVVCCCGCWIHVTAAAATPFSSPFFIYLPRPPSIYPGERHPATLRAMAALAARWGRHGQALAALQLYSACLEASAEVIE